MLLQIGKVNKDKKVFIVILDNFASYRSREVRHKAEWSGIVLVCLPPYSPDLNPIEKVWSVVKRAIAVRFERYIEDKGGF